MKRSNSARRRKVAGTALAGTTVAALSLFGLVTSASADAAPAVPLGALDSVAAGVGTVQVSGWALEPDTTGAVSVQIFVDGVFNQTVVAATERDDVAAAYPGFGALHGYTAALTGLSATAHTVSAYAINTNGIEADNVLLGSQTVSPASTTSFGAVDVVAQDPGGTVEVSGWAIDPKTANPVTVVVYVDGVSTAVVTADAARADVGAAYPGAGAAHGFDVKVPVVATSGHLIDVYAIDSTNNGDNPLLREVNTSAGLTSIGALDSAGDVSGNEIRVSGWAFDPKATGPSSVAIYVDGVGAAIVPAAQERDDVAAVYPTEGADHGYSVTLPATTDGAHVVDVYAIDSTNNGNNPLLGQTTVMVSSSSFGSVDAVNQTTNDNVQVSGWAIDPKTADPISVVVYVDGVATTVKTAGDARSDVGAVYSASGANHGFSIQVPIATLGTHTVDVYAIDSTGNGNNPLLRRSSVVITAPVAAV